MTSGRRSVATDVEREGPPPNEAWEHSISEQVLNSPLQAAPEERALIIPEVPPPPGFEAQDRAPNLEGAEVDSSSRFISRVHSTRTFIFFFLISFVCGGSSDST